jgi:hypothetical protein
MLRHEKLSDRDIATFEAHLCKMIQNGGNLDYSQLAKSVVNKADVVVRIASILSKIGALCGL